MVIGTLLATNFNLKPFSNPMGGAMLRARQIGNAKINPAVFEEPLVPQPPVRLVPMPEKVEFIGFLYETPTQRHPQELSEGWLVRISGAHNEVPNGVYSIEVYEDETPSRVFASAARLVTGLPQRVSKNYYPSFGKNEVSMSEQTYDLSASSQLLKRIDRCLCAANSGFKYVYE